MSRGVYVSVTVIVRDNEEVALRALETFARAAAGIALEGEMVTVTIAPAPDEEDLGGP